MARPREVEVDCEAPFGLVAAQVVEARVADVFAHSSGVLDVADVDRVHDMRVATRRLRAALEVFEPCFPRKRRGKALKRVKELADALGERRDCDVEIELLESFAAEVDEDDRSALEEMVAELRARQGGANERLAPFVRKKRLKKLRKRLDELVGEARA